MAIDTSNRPTGQNFDGVRDAGSMSGVEDTYGVSKGDLASGDFERQGISSYCKSDGMQEDGCGKAGC